MNLAVITENTPVGMHHSLLIISKLKSFFTSLGSFQFSFIGTSVYRLQGADPEGSVVNFGIIGTNKLGVNRQTGVVSITAPIDREV